MRERGVCLTSFDTGDNPNRGTDALHQAVADLVKLGHAPILAIPDLATERKGKPRTFAYKMKDPYGNYYYLVARSTDWYEMGGEEYFGSQLWLVKKVREVDNPFVIATPDGFFVFDPTVMMVTMEGTNLRDGVEMGNFPRKTGLPWLPNHEKLYPVFRAIMLRFG